MKVCSKCKIEKLDDFFIKGSAKCNFCRSEVKKKYYELNKEKIKLIKKEYNEKNKFFILEQKKKYYLKNKDILNKKTKIYYDNNKENLLNYAKKYRQENKEILQNKKIEYCKNNKSKISQKNKKYVLNNKDKVSEYQKKYRSLNKTKTLEYRKKYFKINKDYNKNYFKNRSEKEPIFKFKRCVRTLIIMSFKRSKNQFRKNTKTENILGCKIEDFKTYIQSKFTKGMTLENHGEWHLDHIIPLATAKTEEDIIRLNHYTNFQPLWAEDNIIKSDKIIEQQLTLI
jgi:hypothetical protein